MRGWVVLLLLSGCRQLLGFENLATGEDAAVILPDGACATPTVQCIGDVLRTCSGDDQTDTTCTWGCLDGPTPHCGELQPTGGAVTAADLVDDPALQDVTFGGQSVNTTTGEIAGVRTAGTGVIAGIDFSVRNNVGVFRMRSLDITGDVTFVGTNAVAMVSLRDLHVSGVLDVRGSCAGATAGPGGSNGGTGADGSGEGAGLVGTSGVNVNGGGGGAGHGTVGSNGGTGQTALGGMAGVGFGDNKITILVGGSGGGGGGGTPSARGGGGGGAIQLVSNTSIELANGGINASGCGGERPVAPNDLGGGGGGGSGGAIILEAPTILLDAGLAVNGGAGGGGTSGSTDGEDGRLGTVAAVGGANTGTGGAGGRGGVGGDRSGDSGQNDNAGGGGGAAVGWIRLNTRSGTTEFGPLGFTSPRLMDDATTTSQATADIE